MQLKLLETPVTTWETADDWETPEPLAQRIAAMLQPGEKFIIEPSAGTGHIAAYLPKGAFCIEQNSVRCDIGAEVYKQHHWVLGDFLEIGRYDLPCPLPCPSPDLVIGNPPFSLWSEFLVHALELGAPRVLFIGPCDQFHKPTVWKKLGTLSERIRVVPHPIVGRVAYLKDGVPVQGRQIYDSIFEVSL